MDTETQKPLDLATIKSRLAQSKGKQYWRTLGELAETPRFMEVLANEVPQATRTMHLHMDRRQFLTLAGASLALAGMSGCRYLPERKLVPYVHQPEEMVQGIPMFYASAVPNTGGYGTGALITSREGRPIKIEGNPDHPASLGATDALMQAALLPLYDPDRSQTVLHKGEFSTWDEFFANARHLIDGQRKSGGTGIRILTETVTSPTLADQFKQMLSQFPEAKWIQYEPAGADNVREGARLAFGEVVQTVYHFDKATRILALDADFLLTLPGNIRYSRDFMNGRKIRTDTTDLNRLYVIESTPSITGAMADHRLTVRASEVEGIARAVAARLGAEVGGGPVPTFTGETEKLIAGLVKDLQANAANAVVVPGDLQTAAVHALAHAINAKLGNIGKTVTYTDAVEAAPQNQFAELAALVKDMKAGTVEILLIAGGNPVYTAPADLDFANALISVPYKVHQAQYEDETSLVCDWHLPDSHFLEGWSDIRAYDGTVSLIQPLINPIYDSKSIHELLSGLFDTPPATIDAKTPSNRLTEPRDGYAIVRSYWAAQGVTNDTDFNRLLHDGMVPNSAAKSRDVTFKATAIPATAAIAPSGNSLEIMIRPDPTIWDGRHANNGWLQELPKPFSKVVWDNAAYVSIDTADRLQIPLDFDGAASSHMISVTVKGQKIVAPVWVLPGHPNDSVTLHLGYGRSHAGQIGTDIGFNAYKIFFSDTRWTALGTVEKTGDQYEVATTQHHHLLEGRDIVRSGTITQFKKRPSLAPEAEEAAPEANPADADKNKADDLGRGLDQPNIYPSDEHRWPQNPADPEESFGAYSWGMSIDLQSCIGCSACMVACQSENNIPVVGKQQVLTGRHMNWIRIDTYYKSPTPEPETMLLTTEDTMKRMLHNPEVYFQPMTCQQCEQAPCEPVCPVGATMHSHEGLNQMVYNRCIGTRYCSNNCPYKVRRFNFLNYANHHDIPVKKMLYNPEVTVRGRGVMEKCMYCVQRINHARQKAKIEGKQIQDGDIVTACQQACPTEAIVFGNISDRKSKVYQLKNQPHNYGVLAELNTRPRTTYLGRVTNPNPDIVTETEQHGG